jgi:imidazolonepropionase
MAVAINCDPGSSPLCSLLLALNMACTLFGLSWEEALQEAKRHTAQALGLAEDRGTFAIGRRADLWAWRIQTPAEIVYWLGLYPVEVVPKDGRWSYFAPTR